jgi:Uma2 family endonuclease
MEEELSEPKRFSCRQEGLEYTAGAEPDKINVRERQKPRMSPRGSAMSISTSLPAKNRIVYLEADGEPIAENTVQFRWIVTVKEGLERAFRDRPDVFVAGDLLWYPVESHPEIRQAPDAMVVFGRPKGDRGSYMQRVEGGSPPQVVFEILSPGNRFTEMIKKFDFYERYGVEEYYLTQGELILIDPAGQRFLTFGELALERDSLALERDSLAHERDAVVRELDGLARELSAAREPAERLEAQVLALGLEPQS